MEPYYAAYRTFARMCEEPEFQLRLRLEPGDLLLMDNVRVLHGRTAFSGTGERHLQACYADIDGLRSRLAIPPPDRGRGGGAVSPPGLITTLFDAYREYGRRAYLGEPVTITDHMLQTAALAEADDAPPSLVAAALLHYVAYLLHRPADLGTDGEVDRDHAEIGAAFLARHFPPAVAEPVRLHVAAKRYLCAMEPAYLAALSPASVRTLAAQGGPLAPEEVAGFEARPFARDAVRLRRYDDRGKVAGRPTADLAHYRPLLEGLLRRDAG